MFKFKFLIFSVILTLIFERYQSKLIYVQQVFRHGARYPIGPYEKDYSEYANTERSLGQLTKQGKSMHYILGQKLYDEYWMKLFANTSFEKTYNQSKFYVKSTNFHRTIESVQSQMLGILENLNLLTLIEEDIDFSMPMWPTISKRKPGAVFINSSLFNAIPIHTQKDSISPSDNGDFLRTYDDLNCYKQKQWTQANMKSSKVQQIIRHPKFIQVLQVVGSKLNLTLQFWDFERFYDNALSQIYQRRQHLDIFFKQEYKYIYEAIFMLDTHMKLFMTKQQLSATATGYFNETVNHFKRVIRDQQGVQWSFYSAHDSTINNFLAALNLTNVDCVYAAFLKGIKNNTDTCIIQFPKYTANLIFEVHQNDVGNNTFKIRYNGQYRKIPFCSWKEECEINVFFDWYENWKDQDFPKTCGIVNKQKQIYFSIFVFELGVIFICFLIVALRFLKEDKNRNKLIQSQQTNFKEQLK